MTNAVSSTGGAQSLVFRFNGKTRVNFLSNKRETTCQRENLWERRKKPLGKGMQKRGTWGYKGVLAFMLVVVSLMVLILPSVSSGVIRVSGDRSAGLSGQRINRLVVHSSDSCEVGVTSTFTVAENTEWTYPGSTYHTGFNLTSSCAVRKGRDRVFEFLRMHQF
jgi:hypothetical protein